MHLNPCWPNATQFRTADPWLASWLTCHLKYRPVLSWLGFVCGESTERRVYIKMLKSLRIYNVGITLTGVTFHDCCQSLHTNSDMSVLTTSIDTLSNTSFTNLSFKYICCVIRTADFVDRSPKSMIEFFVITDLSIILSSEYLEATLWASWRIQFTVQWR